MYLEEVTCPYCQYIGKDFILKKEWNTGSREVNLFICPSCKQIFRLYWGKRRDNTLQIVAVKGRGW